LRDDLCTVPVVLDYPDDPADLTFDPAQSPYQVAGGVLVELHDTHRTHTQGGIN
jgi:hypothetical protein